MIMPPSAVHSRFLQHKESHTYSSISTAPPVRPARGQVESRKACMTTPTIYGMFETRTGSWQYVVVDTSTMRAAIIDPVLDYDLDTQSLAGRTANSLITFTKECVFKVDKILETHVHEDHISASPFLQRWFACDQGYISPIYIGRHIKEHQSASNQKDKIPREEYQGSFVRFLADKEVFNVGELNFTAVHLPGHSPHHLGYEVGGALLRYPQ